MDSLNHRNVTHLPEVLCVAETFPWKVGVWRKTSGRFKQIKRKKTQILLEHHYGVKYAPKGYVASVGTCRGDSGGPLYVKEYDEKMNRKNILTGWKMFTCIKF